jgi:hypothetical protein
MASKRDPSHRGGPPSGPAKYGPLVSPGSRTVPVNLETEFDAGGQTNLLNF